MKRMTWKDQAPRVVAPGDLIGSGEAASILGITKPSLTRRIAAGTMTPLAQLDGARGVFVFDRNDVESAKAGGKR